MGSSRTDKLLETALFWAEQGVPVFPCGADKAPLTKKGFMDAVTDPQAVAELFKFYGEAAHLVGGRMGQEAGMFAIDVDLYKGPEVEAWLQDLIDKGLMVATRTHKTMRGGLHFLYESDKYPNVYPIDGVEVRGEGAYIIMAGSPGYTVIQEGLAQAPDALIAALLKKQRQHANETVDDLKQKILKAENFHDSLARLAARYSASGWTAEKTQAALIEVLRASVAANPEHPRHDRWKFLIENQGDEFGRITSTSHRKFNSRAASDDMAAEPDEIIRLKKVADKAGFFTPTSRDEPEKITKAEDIKGWPFEGVSYNFADQHDLLNQKFVLHPVVVESETGLVSGAPKAGKSAFMLDIGIHVALGIDVSPSLKVPEQRTVLYFALEGRRATQLRIQAKREWLEKEKIKIPDFTPLFVIERGTPLLEEMQRQQFVEQVLAAERYITEQGWPELGLIIVDTFTRTMPGGDQNSVEDTSAVFDAINRLRDRKLKAAVWFIHHLSRAGNIRGSTNIEAEPDILCRVVKDEGRSVFSVDHARSIEEGARFPFRLQNWDIGKSSQGFMINAPIVTMDDDHSYTNHKDEFQEGKKENKIMSLIVGMGKGEHSLQAVHDLLHREGYAPVSTRRSVRGDMKNRAIAVNTAIAQEFYAALIPEIGRVFSGFAITRLMVDGHIGGIAIR